MVERFAGFATIVGAGLALSLLAACQMKASPRTVTTSLCLDGGKPAYFADGAFDSRPDLDRFTRDWYSERLSAMAEPSLQCATAYPVYPFIWLRTFHCPIAIRVERRDDGMYLFAIELDGAGGYGPGKESRWVERELRPAQAKEFVDVLTKARVREPIEEEQLLMTDGARWIVEARDGARYRLHDRQSPETGRVLSIGTAFLKLTGWTIPPKDMY